MKGPRCTARRDDGVGTCLQPASQRIVISRDGRPAAVGFRCEKHEVEASENVAVYALEASR